MIIGKKCWKRMFLLVIVFLISLGSASSINNLLGFQANVYDSNGNLVSSGDIGIEIWDSASEGNLIYNSTDNYIGNISNGKVDVILGEITDLNLDYGKDYYMDVFVNHEDLDFSGNERRRFQSSIGNITTDYIGNSNITTNLIQDAAITAAKILDRTLTELDILEGNLTSSVIADIFVKNTGDDVDGDLTVGGGYSNSGITLQNGTGDLWIGGDIFVNGELVRVDASQINGSILFGYDEVFTIGNETSKPAIIYTKDLNATGTIYAVINSISQSINIIIQDLISNTQLNATLLDSVASDSVLNSTERLIDNTTLSNMINSVGGSPWSQSANIIYNDSSNIKVGIGTANPTSILDIYGSTSAGSVLLLNVSNVLYVNETKVGIITTNPSSTLEVQDSLTNIPTVKIGTLPLADVLANSILGQLIFTAHDDSGGAGRELVGAIKSVARSEISNWNGLNSREKADMAFFVLDGTDDSGNSIYEAMRIEGDTGNVGINTAAPTHKLNVYGTMNVSDLAHFDSNVSMADNLTVGNALFVDSSSGRVGIGTSFPTHTLNVDGTGNFTGNTTFDAGFILDSTTNKGRSFWNGTCYQIYGTSGVMEIC